MKKILIPIVMLILSTVFSQAVMEDNKRESFQAKISVNLIRTDNSIVNILDGTQFIELKTGSEATDFGGVLAGVTAPIGEYKGVTLTLSAFKHKLKIHPMDDYEPMFYTTDREVAYGDPWLLSTNSADYGYTTTLAPEGGLVFSTTFPKPLQITANGEANLIWINKFGGTVDYKFPDGIEDDGNLSKIIWADEPTLIRAFLPDIPTKMLSYTIRYTQEGESVKENRVTYFLNNSNELIGAFMSRPPNKALNGSDLILGNNDGNNYSIRFQDANDSDDGINGNDYYDVNVTLDCEADNPDRVTDISVEAHGVASLPDDGYTLNGANLSCTDINMP